jgi:hypothetical protein
MCKVLLSNLCNSILLINFFPVAIPSVYKDWDEDDITGKVIQ